MWSWFLDEAAARRDWRSCCCSWSQSSKNLAKTSAGFGWLVAAEAGAVVPLVGWGQLAMVVVAPDRRRRMRTREGFSVRFYL